MNKRFKRHFFILLICQEREAEFRDLSEAVNSKIVWWTVLQFIVLGTRLACSQQHRRNVRMAVDFAQELFCLQEAGLRIVHRRHFGIKSCDFLHLNQCLLKPTSEMRAFQSCTLLCTSIKDQSKRKSASGSSSGS